MSPSPPPPLDAAKLVGLLADEDRRRVVAALILGAVFISLLPQLLTRYSDALPGADAVFLALALTPETEGIISAGELSLMERHAWLINVARGAHVVTDDLVVALRSRQIGGAGLDVTDPEPLPKGHVLWGLPNCLITPHVGNTPEMAVPLLAERIKLNVRRYAHGQELIGLIDPELGY